MTPGRRYDGPAVDATEQYLSEAPFWNDPDGETVYATDAEPAGEETTVDEPADDGDQEDVDDDSEQDSNSGTRDRVRRSRTRPSYEATTQATFADFGGGGGA